jgi:hypothetical protein
MSEKLEAEDQAYANPQPFQTVEVERRVLARRVEVARGIARRASNPRKAARWSQIADRLLDHYMHAEDRVASEAIAAALRGDQP